MKKYLNDNTMTNIVGSGIAVMVLFFNVLLFTHKTELANAIGSRLRSGGDIPTGSLKMRTSDSTTTPEFIIAGLASSTLTFASENLSSVAMELQVFASSTATNSRIQVELQASDNLIDFYPYQVASSPNFFIYNPPKGATSPVFADLDILPARYTRAIIGISTTTVGTVANKDRANVWANLVGVIN